MFAGAAVGLSGGPWRKLRMNVTLQLKIGVTASRSSRAYYVAQDKGSMKRRPNVHGSTGRVGYRRQHRFLAGGGADVAVEWMPCRFGRSVEKACRGQYRTAVQVVWHDADLPQGRGIEDHRRL